MNEIDELISEVFANSCSERDAAEDELVRLARLGASVESMPEGAQLRHRHGGRWMLYPDYADTLNLNSGATPQEALDKFKRVLESTTIR